MSKYDKGFVNRQLDEYVKQRDRVRPIQARVAAPAIVIAEHLENARRYADEQAAALAHSLSPATSPAPQAAVRAPEFKPVPKGWFYGKITKAPFNGACLDCGGAGPIGHHMMYRKTGQKPNPWRHRCCWAPSVAPPRARRVVPGQLGLPQ